MLDIASNGQPYGDLSPLCDKRDMANVGQNLCLHVQQCSKCKRTHTRRNQRYCHACHAANMRRHRAKVAAAVDALVRATGGGGACDIPRARRVIDRVERLDELAAAASGIARSGTRRARQATRLALGVAAAMALASATVVAQPPSAPVPRPRASNPACTPVMLCPYPGGTGGAGTGSGGTGGGGTGGASSAGRGGGGGGVPAGGIRVSAPLTLDRAELSPGQTLRGEVTYENTSAGTLIVIEIRIAARAPGATHEGGPYTDLAPVLRNVVIQAQQTVTLQASRTFTASDALGQWEAYSTHQDASGWHDAPSVHFNVAAGSGAAGGGAPPPLPDHMTVGTQEWFVASWSGAMIYKSNVNWSTAYASGTNIWRPEFLAQLQGFTVFRHMDTNAVNWSDISRWSQRKLPNDPGNQEIYIDPDSSPSTTGMAVEWQIDLCARANIDCWFTVPFLADDDYIRQQAQLIKAKLPSHLRVYVELSNEVWNCGFSQCEQAIDAGNAGGFPGSNEWYRGIAFELHRALAMYALYAEVFGASAMGTRVIRVFSESGNLDLTTQAFKNVYRSSHWNPSGQVVDMIAMAPYIGNGQNGATESLSRWKGEVDSKMNGDIRYAHDTHVKPYAIPLFGCYEAGMHHLSGADQWAANPDAADAYLYMLDRFAERMNGPCALYTLHGDWKPDGAWGLYDNVGQADSAAPKARGTKDWIAGQMRAAPTIPWALLLTLLLIAIGIAFCLYRIRVHRAALEAHVRAQAVADVDTAARSRPTLGDDDKPKGAP